MQHKTFCLWKDLCEGWDSLYRKTFWSSLYKSASLPEQPTVWNTPPLGRRELNRRYWVLAFVDFEWDEGEMQHLSHSVII